MDFAGLVGKGVAILVGNSKRSQSLLYICMPVSEEQSANLEEKTSTNGGRD